MEGLYYNPYHLHLSGREYEVIDVFPDGRKLIKFPSFGNLEIIAYPKDLDGTFIKSCEHKWEEEQLRIAKVHGWKN